MKVLHIIPDVNAGGASKGAYRIHQAVKKMNVDSRLLVLKKNLDEDGITNVNAGITGWLGRKFYKELNRSLNNRFNDFKTDNQALHSFGLARRGILNTINASDADIIHLHWISNMLSIEDVGRISKPIAWTFHDMWPLCGAEHYVMDASPTARFNVGYLKDNQPTFETGPDYNRFTWERKINSWKGKTFHIATCSSWLAQCAQSSLLFKDQYIRPINYPLDVDHVFKPYTKAESRHLFKLPADKKIVLAGAVDGVANFYKGGDLLKKSADFIKDMGRTDIVLALFGSHTPAGLTNWPIPVIDIGRIYDEVLLAKLYSAADVFVMPSRQEAFGQVASEAQACGTPVVAFNNSGPIDIVDHLQTGYLAKPYDTFDLATGIVWAIDQKDGGAVLSNQSRERAKELFSPQVAGKKYLDMYSSMLKY